MAFAKDNDGRKNNDRKENRSCLRALGHLVAPGWIKLNNEIDARSECNLPFGISKKFRGQASTTPVVADTTAPLISNIESSPRLTDATVSWTTNEQTKGTVFFATTTGVNANSASTTRVSEGFMNEFFRKDKDRKDENRVVLRGLAAGTAYYAIIRAEDKAGNVTQSQEFSFTTKTPSVMNDVTVPAISTVVTATGTGIIAVAWKTNEPSSSKVFYATNTPINTGTTTASFVQSEELTAKHLVIIPNLSANTKYYLVAQSKDAAGNTQSTAEFSATTK